MLIKWNKTNVHSFASPDGKDIKWVKPGLNEFPNTMWAHIKDHPHVKTMLNNKDMELFDSNGLAIPANHYAEQQLHDQHSETKGTVLKSQPRYLGQDQDEVALIDVSDEKAAIEMVKSTNDTKILDRWYEQDNRSKVKKTIKDQQKKMTEGTQRSAEH